jgi:2-iminobutanoate/2-iminopropanoate deaminase
MRKEVIRTTAAPVYPPISQAVKTGKIVQGNMTWQVFKNLGVVLEAAGSSLENVVKATVFLKDKADFEIMNEIWRETFSTNPPARSTILVGLVGEAKAEIEVVAVVSKP